MAERTVIQSISGQKGLVFASPETTICEAARVMTRANCGSLLVLDTAGGLLGIVTERDFMTRVIARAMDPARTTVADVMTRHPICIPPETTVADAVLIMIERGFRHLPIVTPPAKILGVFSVRDALPREIDTAESLAQFHEQINDALG